jgi:hypothetical protein
MHLNKKLIAKEWPINPKQQATIFAETLMTL